MPRQHVRPLIALCASLLVIGALTFAITNPSAAQGPCRGNWAEGNTYNVGDSVLYNGAAYTCLQAHTAYVGANWNPASTPSLWRTGGTCTGGTPTPTPAPTPTPTPTPTPGPTPTPTPTPTPGTGCGGVPAWSATAIYTAGMRATVSGFIYEAKWWNQNQNPATNSGGDGPWRPIGPCVSPGPTPNPGSGFAQVVSQTQFNQMFPNRNPFYTYQGLLDAAATFPAFAGTGDLAMRRREAAAAMANFAHETGGLVHVTEIAKGLYCSNSATPCGVCASGQSYYGRGPIQLSWNFNPRRFRYTLESIGEAARVTALVCVRITITMGCRQGSRNRSRLHKRSRTLSANAASPAARLWSSANTVICFDTLTT